MARRVKNIPVKDGFLILTNGKRSEKNYFEELRSLNQSIFKIKVKFLNDDPEMLVNHAIPEKKSNNKVWCVFDKDEFKSDSIYNAIKKAKENNIGIAFSNISFEVWLVDHFRKCNNERTVDQLICELDTILKNNGFSQGYLKSDEKTIKKLFLPNIDTAINNAKILDQKRKLEYSKNSIENTNYPVCEWNSYTNVHQLIEALSLNRRKV